MIIIAISGMIDKTDSTLPLFESDVFSVTYELKLASFEVEPKKVIIKSNTITKTAAKNGVIDRVFPSLELTFNRPKQAVDIPHNIYPNEMNNFLCPTLSVKAPIKIVVKVAMIAEAAVVIEIKSE